MTCTEGTGTEPTPPLDREVVALAPLDPAAELAGPPARGVEVGGALDLVAELDHPDAALLQDDGVVVELIPPLAVQRAWFLLDELHAERLAVV